MTRDRIAWSLRDEDCPCCDLVGAFKPDRLAEYAFCPRCGWQNDLVQRDHPSLGLGANHGISLHEARRRWAAGEPTAPHRTQTRADGFGERAR